MGLTPAQTRAELVVGLARLLRDLPLYPATNRRVRTAAVEFVQLLQAQIERSGAVAIDFLADRVQVGGQAAEEVSEDDRERLRGLLLAVGLSGVEFASGVNLESIEAFSRALAAGRVEPDCAGVTPIRPQFADRSRVARGGGDDLERSDGAGTAAESDPLVQEVRGDSGVTAAADRLLQLLDGGESRAESQSRDMIEAVVSALPAEVRGDRDQVVPTLIGVLDHVAARMARGEDLEADDGSILDVVDRWFSRVDGPTEVSADLPASSDELLADDGDLESFLEALQELPELAERPWHESEIECPPEQVEALLYTVCHTADEAIRVAAMDAATDLLQASEPDTLLVLESWIQKSEQPEHRHRLVEFCLRPGATQAMRKLMPAGVDWVIATFPTTFVGFVETVRGRDARDRVLMVCQLLGARRILSARNELADGLARSRRLELIFAVRDLRLAPVWLLHVVGGGSIAPVLDALLGTPGDRPEHRLVRVLRSEQHISRELLVQVLASLAGEPRAGALATAGSKSLALFLNDSRAIHSDRKLAAIQLSQSFRSKEVLAALARLASRGLFVSRREQKQVRDAARQMLDKLRERYV